MQSLVYILNREASAKITISSPWKAAKMVTNGEVGVYLW